MFHSWRLRQWSPKSLGMELLMVVIYKAFEQYLRRCKVRYGPLVISNWKKIASLVLQRFSSESSQYRDIHKICKAHPTYKEDDYLASSSAVMEE